MLLVSSKALFTPTHRQREAREIARVGDLDALLSITRAAFTRIRRQPRSHRYGVCGDHNFDHNGIRRERVPIVIGAKPESNFADPIGLLTDCHRRIERFLGVLVRLGEEYQGGLLTAELRNSLDTALRYFRDAAPKHTADEEETLFPSLRPLDSPGAQAVLARVDSLESEHIAANERHAEVDRLGQMWLDAGTLPPAGAERFRSLVQDLAAIYREHIAIKEREVFPFAASALSKPERERMGSEMAARRGLDRG